MIEKIIKAIIVAIVLFVAYLAFSYLVAALVASTGFAYGALVIAIIAVLLILGYCLFILRLFGVSI